ncbi:hypothetical protein PR048_001413 [Dryococelus australis]|uniref:Uncharacterized protein n=1 Tax=Dryococelus australis TaxID=614101 RepID=A0ABQ9IHF2_9NEOP|nr:hypothetical protein PR048_001413 [Dryococelus australis]
MLRGRRKSSQIAQTLTIQLPTYYQIRDNSSLSLAYQLEKMDLTRTIQLACSLTSILKTIYEEKCGYSAMPAWTGPPQTVLVLKATIIHVICHQN